MLHLANQIFGRHAAKGTCIYIMDMYPMLTHV
jgi:hypothetical protein